MSRNTFTSGGAPSPAGKIANTEKPGAAQSANPLTMDGQPPAPGQSESSHGRLKEAVIRLNWYLRKYA